MNLPQFPTDFKILYSEGASYWWWSPFTGPDWDGTKLADDPSPWPCGLIVGDHDTSHELVVGQEAVVVWTDFEDTHDVLDEPFCYLLDENVQSAINRFLPDILARLEVETSS